MSVPLRVRRDVALRDGAIPGEQTHLACTYCGARGTVDWARNLNGAPSRYLVFFYELEIDHVIPRHHGGSDDVENLVLACGRCNRRKSFRRTPEDMHALLDAEAAA